MQETFTLVLKQYGTTAFSGAPGNYLKYFKDFRV